MRTFAGRLGVSHLVESTRWCRIVRARYSGIRALDLSRNGSTTILSSECCESSWEGSTRCGKAGGVKLKPHLGEAGRFLGEGFGTVGESWQMGVSWRCSRTVGSHCRTSQGRHRDRRRMLGSRMPSRMLISSRMSSESFGLVQGCSFRFLRALHGVCVAHCQEGSGAATGES